MAVGERGSDGSGTDDHPQCQHVSCVQDNPEDLLLRTLTGVDWYGVYCRQHDPMDDPDAHKFWEVPDDGDR